MSSKIYLYVKTHNKTGLKYLGKTVSDDPYTYQGSGKLWKRHIAKHGYDVITEILLVTDDKLELKEAGIHYSNLWNIVESKSFANLMPETGDGGAQAWTEESRKKLSAATVGVKATEEAKKNMSAAQQRVAKEASERMKEHLSDSDIRAEHNKRLRQNCNYEKISKTISTLKWCNDGNRNYRLVDIPENYSPGKLKKLK